MCLLIHRKHQNLAHWHTPAPPHWVTCTLTDWPRALISEILPGSQQASSPLKLKTKLPSSSSPCCQTLTPPPPPSLSRAFPHRCAISLQRAPLRSLMHLWKKISFSLPSHFNVFMSRSRCSAFRVLFCFVLYGNFILNKHYMAVKGMRWLRGSVMGCEAFPF